MSRIKTTIGDLGLMIALALVVVGDTGTVALYSSHAVRSPDSTDAKTTLPVKRLEAPPSPVVHPATAKMIASPPLIMTIPAIGLSSKVVEVGTTSADTIGVPPTPWEVAYWSGSQLPGAAGVTILDGHLDWYGVPCAVFCRLAQAPIGSHIGIQLTNGATETWRITSSSTINSAGSVPAWMLANTGSPKLVIITCAGDWNPASRNYNERLLVQAVLVGYQSKHRDSQAASK